MPLVRRYLFAATFLTLIAWTEAAVSEGLSASENISTTSRTVEDYGDAGLISTVNPYDSPNVRKSPSGRGIPIAVRTWANYSRTSDFELRGVEYFKVLRSPHSNTVIGFIAIEDACSSEMELCYTTIARFDINGSLIGDIEEESRGIYE